MNDRSAALDLVYSLARLSVVMELPFEAQLLYDDLIAYIAGNGESIRVRTILQRDERALVLEYKRSIGMPMTHRHRTYDGGDDQ